MSLQDTLQLFRKRHGYSQEQLADRLGIARQTVSKWENGQAVPEIGGLISLSRLYGTTLDRLVKGPEPCATGPTCGDPEAPDPLIAFLLDAKRNTYAAAAPQASPCRTGCHDYRYLGPAGYAYLDSYLGGERFAGQEAVWQNDRPLWAMNYLGRVLAEPFSGDFLKQALLAVPAAMPYRGPALFSQGDYCYHCRVEGDFSFFQGWEEIFYREGKVYECCFHGGFVR